jgi:hypothetical protein
LASVITTLLFTSYMGSVIDNLLLTFLIGKAFYI